MANIPDHIMYLCILPKLPVKSLIRFKCVSKSWQTLITSPDFIRLHHRHTVSSDKNRQLICTGLRPFPYFDLYNLDSPSDPPSKCFYPKLKTLEDFKNTSPVVASCEFFLLLNISDELILLNPSTRTYHEIPRQNLTPYIGYDVKYGLCFDEVNDDYKVIRITSHSDHQNRHSMDAMIYSFKTNSWRLIYDKLTSNDFYDYSKSNDVFVVNNLLYMILATTSANDKGKIRIGCFDITAEQWTNDIPLPENDYRGYNLLLIDGSICILGRNKERPIAHCVWVMKDRRWVKLMSIADSKNCRRWRPEYLPITYRTGSRDELLLSVRKTSFSLFWYSLKDKMAKDTEFNLKDELIYSGFEDHVEHVCKGSLVAFAYTLPSSFPAKSL